MGRSGTAPGQAGMHGPTHPRGRLPSLTAPHPSALQVLQAASATGRRVLAHLRETSRLQRRHHKIMDVQARWQMKQASQGSRACSPGSPRMANLHAACPPTPT